MAGNLEVTRDPSQPAILGNSQERPPTAQPAGRAGSPSHRGPGAFPTHEGLNPSTRVMSPNTGSHAGLAIGDTQPQVSDRQIVLATPALSPSLRSDLQEARAQQGIRFIECEVCMRLCYEPKRCCECHRVGHPECLRLHWFHNFLFCHPCLPAAVHKWNQARTEYQRLQWMHRCDRAREMQIQWRICFNGAADVAGTIVSGAAMSALTSSMRFASSVASGVASALPSRAIEDAPHPTQQVPMESPAPLSGPEGGASGAASGGQGGNQEAVGVGVAPAPPSSGDSLRTAATHASTAVLGNQWRGQAGSSHQARPSSNGSPVTYRIASRSSSPARDAHDVPHSL